MTLVVARRSLHGIRFAADSHVTEKLGLRSNLLQGALKVVILSREVCVACAGDRAKEAFESVRQASRVGGAEVAAVEQHFQEAARAVGGVNEFLVASLRHPISLSRVTSGGILREPKMQWIGDADAFNAFQRYRLGEWWKVELEDSEGNPVELDVRPAAEEQRRLRAEAGSCELLDDIETDSRIADALQKVIDDDAVATVGGLLIRTEGAPRHGFHYTPMARMVGGHRLPDEPEIAEGVIQRVTAAEGAFGYRICTVDPGVGALGVYFIQGSFGAFLCPTLQDETFVCRSVTQAGFEAAVKERFGFELRC